MKINPVGCPEISQLKTFIALAQSGDLEAVAFQLQLPSAKLMNEIAAIEAMLGVTLFISQHERYSLTNAGLAFMEQAQLILAHHKQIRSLRQLSKRPLIHLDIIFPAWLPHNWLVILLNQLHHHQPNMSISCCRDEGQPPRGEQLFINFDAQPRVAGWHSYPWQPLPLIKVSHPDQLRLPRAMQGIACLFDFTATHQSTRIVEGENLVVQALLQNLGWAILPSASVANHLLSGRLVDWQESIPTPMVYWHTGPEFSSSLHELMRSLLISHQF